MNFIKTFLAGLLAFFVGSVLFFFFGIMLLVGIIAAAGSGETVTVHPSSILKIDLQETLTDSPSADPLSGIDLMTLQTDRRLTLFKALRAIEAAKEDARIEGIYLRMNGTGGVAGSALLEELREALADFKQSGKFIVSYDEAYTQGRYYLASVADKIYLHPEGGIDWSGMAVAPMFFKGLFDKLDIKAEVFRPTECKYKSAVEPYIMTKMSDENRRQMQQLVNSMWGTISSTVAEARGIEPARMKQITDDLLVTLPEEALEYGFVDSLLYEDRMKGVFADLGVEPKSDGEYEFISLGSYATQVSGDVKNISADQVAVIYADGEIVDGTGSGKKIFGNTMAATIAGVRDDEKVKAVVLRVNSPGGSALASDVIWREIELLKAEKPVIVSMGSYAASGGYYISCPADAILADKLTLTGSIGVFGMYFYTADALKNKLGITFDIVKSNSSAGMGSVAPLTALERATIMRGVDKVYTTFTGNVAVGRNLPLEKVLDIAQGRVWSGEDALGIGLIDAYGGLRAAIALAADKAGISESFRIKEVVEEPTGFAAILASLNAKVRAAFSQPELGELTEYVEKLREAASQQGTVMYYPYTLELK